MAFNTYSLDLESGSSQYARANDSPSLSITGNGTWEGWIKIEDLSVRCPLFYKFQDTGVQKSYFFEIKTDGRISVGISSDGSAYTAVNIGTAGDFTTGTWTHVAFVYTAALGKVEVFKNGVSVGSNSTFPTSIFDSTEVFDIGRDQFYSVYYDGLIDEVRVWSKARTGVEILADYQTQLVGNEANLNAYWQLNNLYTDLTANANTLTASGSPVFSLQVPFVGTETFLLKEDGFFLLQENGSKIILEPVASGFPEIITANSNLLLLGVG